MTIYYNDTYGLPKNTVIINNTKVPKTTSDERIISIVRNILATPFT